MSELEMLLQDFREIKARIRQIRADNRKKSIVDPTQFTREERLSRVLDLPELSEGLYLLLTDEGFKTGSEVYGNIDNPADQDWCIMVPPYIFEGYALGSDQNYWIEDGFVTCYAHYKGEILNIICISDLQLYEAWYYTTMLMKDLSVKYVDPCFQGTARQPLYNVFKDKWSRVRVFRALREVMTPPKELDKPLNKIDALNWSKCTKCGGEAINFTCKPAKQKYLASGICERCTTKM